MYGEKYRYTDKTTSKINIEGVTYNMEKPELIGQQPRKKTENWFWYGCLISISNYCLTVKYPSVVSSQNQVVNKNCHMCASQFIYILLTWKVDFNNCSVCSS